MARNDIIADLHKLPAREYDVVSMRLLGELTWSQLAARMRVSRTRVRQLYQAALKRLSRG